MRQKLWLIFLKLSKTPKGSMIPKWLHLVRFILFPIDYIFWRHSKTTGYQIEKDVWIIEGQQYTGELMRHFAYGNNETFKIIKRENGYITIARIET